MLLSMASMGFPMRWMPLSITLATGLGVFRATDLAAEIFPEVI